MMSEESSINSDLSFNEYNNLLKEDPSRLLYVTDIKMKQGYRKLLQDMLTDYNEAEIYRHLFLNPTSNEMH